MAKLIKIFGAVFLILAVLIIFRAVRSKNTASISLSSSPSVSPSVFSSPSSSTFESDSIIVNGIRRTYHVFIPSSYSNNCNINKKYPLVIVFHGGGGNGVKIAEQTNFNQTAEREEIIVVYPDGFMNNWNDGRGVTEAERLGIDDIAFVKALINKITSDLPNIDENRIYATGMSNGGIFTYRLGCEMADLFAAIAPVAAGMAEPIFNTCSPANKISVLTINGTADPFIPLEGGECCKRGLLGDGGRLASLVDSLNIFISKNKCSSPPQIEKLPIQVNDGTEVEKTTYSCRRSKNVVKYLIFNGGHAWPPAPVPRINGISSKNINATEVIWEFFKKHSKI